MGDRKDPSEDQVVPGQQGQITDLQGKVALVTGATSGIGLETAAELARRGATVIFGVRNQKKAEGVAQAMRERVPDARLILPPEVPLIDMMSLPSVKAFAAGLLERADLPIDILVNNAGVADMKRVYAPGHIGGLAQTNYLGPYTLTRLLEPKLVASKARVVTVSSVTHRAFVIHDPDTFLHQWSQGTYLHTKLACCLVAYELQRRLSPYGVQSVSLDPGGVRTAIWKDSVFDKQPLKAVIEFTYAPPEDAAVTVAHAATVAWEKVMCSLACPPANDLRFYARGLFASPLVTRIDGSWTSWWATVAAAAYGVNLVVHSLLDFPLRSLSGGRLASRVVPVKSSPQTYDKVLAARLWDASAVAAGVSRDVMRAKPGAGPNAGQTTTGPVAGEPAGPEVEPAGDDVVRAGLHTVNTDSSTAATVRKSRKLGADTL
ncbi:MAG: hypothetical protein WDW36_001641 [Sanguina aurantia]